MDKLTDEEIRAMQERIKSLDMLQYAIKIIINSFYGAFGNNYCYFYNRDIAQSITLQAKDLILFSIRVLNHYANEKWHVDRELHEKLGISSMRISKIDVPICIYSDTDSIYATFMPFVKSIEGIELGDEAKIQFVIAIINERLKEYLARAFEAYSKSFGTKNRMDFKLENISECGIWNGKKHYAIRVAYEDDIIMRKRKIVAKGIELAMPSFPEYARERQRELLGMLMDKGMSIVHEKDLLPRIVEMRKAFEHMDVEDVSCNYNIREYDKYVSDDSVLVVPKGMPMHSRASLYHNNMISLTSNRRYYKIRQGDKVKFYYAKTDDPEKNCFAFLPGNYPVEFAFPIDRDAHFMFIIVEPINKLLDSMGLQTIGPDMRRYVKYNMPKTKRAMTPSEIYPLYVINNTTLEHFEMPAHLTKYFHSYDGEKPSDELLEEYVKCVSAFANNTEVVPKFYLEDYIKKRRDLMAKASARSKIKNLSEEAREFFDAAVSALKSDGVKYSVDDNGMPVFSYKKTGKAICMPFENVQEFESPEELVGYVRGTIMIIEDDKNI